MADKSIAMIDRMIAETNSKDPEVYALKAGVHYNAGQFEQTIEAVRKAKPEGAKGKFIKGVSICSTMGKGVSISL